MKAYAFLAALALAVPAAAQMRELPDAPEPKPEATETFQHAQRRKIENKQKFEGPTHKFYDKTAKIQLGVNAALFAFDAAQTCRNLAAGGHEDWLPTQNCAAAVAMMAGFHGAQEIIAWQFHKHGHHKLERITRFYMTGAHITAIAYSKANGAW